MRSRATSWNYWNKKYSLLFRETIEHDDVSMACNKCYFENYVRILILSVCVIGINSNYCQHKVSFIFLAYLIFIKSLHKFFYDTLTCINKVSKLEGWRTVACIASTERIISMKPRCIEGKLMLRATNVLAMSFPIEIFGSHVETCSVVYKD